MLYRKIITKIRFSKTESAKTDLLSSDLYSSITASLREGFSILNKFTVKEIVCFGLGQIGECMISRYQLALLYALKELYNVNVKIYDPIFKQNELDALNELDFEILSENHEGKFAVNNLDGLTLFYLPHCPKQLTNNLLWTNWSLKLSNCVIISNSFHKIIESNTKRHVNNNAFYIISILPYVVELAIINSFKYYEIFNDMAIHIFPIEKIELLPTDFWLNPKEPNYDDSDVEFITNCKSLKIE